MKQDRNKPSIGTLGGFSLQPQPLATEEQTEVLVPEGWRHRQRSEAAGSSGVGVKKGEEVMSFRKLPAGSAQRGEARKNNPPDSITASSTVKLKS